MTRVRRLMAVLCVCVVSAAMLSPAAAGAEREREGGEHREREARERRERAEHGGREVRERRERERHEQEDREVLERRERERRRDDDELRGVRGAMHQALRGVPEDEREHVIRFVREHFEAELAEAEELAEEEPREAREIVTDVVHEARELLELREEEPEQFEKAMRRMETERRASELAERCRASKGEARERLMKELRGVLNEAFSMRQAAMEEETRELEEELKRLRTLIEKREANRDAIVERRIEELTGEEEFLEW